MGLGPDGPCEVQLRSQCAPFHFAACFWRLGRQVDTGGFAPLRDRQLLYDYLSTLAEYSKFEYTDLEVEVDGGISKAETGYSFGEVFIRRI